ncbi:MAG TPA: hypothetical protein V6D02_16170 [Candidatus Obscuribacterales bacterium]
MSLRFPWAVGRCPSPGAGAQAAIARCLSPDVYPLIDNVFDIHRYSGVSH